MQFSTRPRSPEFAPAPEAPLDMNRRQALGQLAVGLGSMMAALSLPQEARADELVQPTGPYKLRDIEATYQLWRAQNKATHLPSLEVFREALSVCRQAACSIFLMKGTNLVASHSAFVMAIPDEVQTVPSRGKLYVVTCDHARLEHAGARPIIQLSNGQTVHPELELVARSGAKGIPVKDLRIYECRATAFKDTQPLPFTEIDDKVISQDAPVMTYEPLNLRASQVIDVARRTVTLDQEGSKKPVLEKLVLSHITGPQAFPHDANYPESSGFSTAGMLRVGGSGSPVIIFSKNDFKVAGHQVSYGNPGLAESEHQIDGEIDNDGHVVHIGHAMQLLREKGRWK